MQLAVPSVLKDQRGKAGVKGVCIPDKKMLGDFLHELLTKTLTTMG